MHAGAGATGETTTSTHLRLQQADLLHLLQRQQSVADRVLEQHVQQHLEREPGHQSQRGPGLCRAPLPGRARLRLRLRSGLRPEPRPNSSFGLARTPQSFLTMAPAPGPARNAVSGLWRADRDTGGHALRAVGQSEIGDDTSLSLRKGLRRGTARRAVGVERAPAGQPFPVCAAAWTRLVAGLRGPGPSSAGRGAVWKSAFLSKIVQVLMCSSYKLRVTEFGENQPGGPARAEVTIPRPEVVVESASRSAGDSCVRPPPLGPLGPGLPLGADPPPESGAAHPFVFPGSVAWSKLAQTLRERHSWWMVLCFQIVF